MTQPLTPPTKDGRSVPDGLSRSASSPQAVSPVPASIPSAETRFIVEEAAKEIDPDAWHQSLPTDGCGLYWIGRRNKARMIAGSVVSMSMVWAADIADGHKRARLAAVTDARLRKAKSEARDHESMAIEASHISAYIRSQAAQAIEARRAETGTGSVHESAVPEGMRP